MTAVEDSADSEEGKRDRRVCVESNAETPRGKGVNKRDKQVKKLLLGLPLSFPVSFQSCIENLLRDEE